MGRNGGKIGKPARERVLEVCEADSADYRTRTDCIRAHENMQLRHARNLPKQPRSRCCLL